MKCGFPGISIFCAWFPTRLLTSFTALPTTGGAKLFYPPTFLFLDYLVKYALSHDIDHLGEITLKKTREGIREELGMTVKTINRTITKLKSDGLIGIRKGKVTLNLEQLSLAQDALAAERAK